MSRDGSLPNTQKKKTTNRRRRWHAWAISSLLDDVPTARTIHVCAFSAHLMVTIINSRQTTYANRPETCVVCVIDAYSAHTRRDDCATVVFLRVNRLQSVRTHVFDDANDDDSLETGSCFFPFFFSLCFLPCYDAVWNFILHKKKIIKSKSSFVVLLRAMYVFYVIRFARRDNGRQADFFNVTHTKIFNFFSPVHHTSTRRNVSRYCYDSWTVHHRYRRSDANAWKKYENNRSR